MPDIGCSAAGVVNLSAAYRAAQQVATGKVLRPASRQRKRPEFLNGAPLMDHDQLFKTLLRTFFLEFFELFFPDWAARFDFTRIEWQDKELFLDPPRGETRRIDLLARLPVRQPVTAGADAWL